MFSSASDIIDMFNTLESNRSDDVKEVLQRFIDMFNSISDRWLVNGFIDYYHTTGSLRSVDILIKVPTPHDKYLFDKLSEGLKTNKRCETLDLLGHIVRRQPLWLFKIVKSPLFKDLLNLLKSEKDIVPLMSALLVLITLLPMIPQLISPLFQDIFEVFGRLAAYESYRGTEHLEGYREHLQMGLYGLFHNLYGMYPCNFVDYLRREYSRKENIEIFTHTVKPMLETVKVHPFLITASKNTETDNARWKKMEHHDVLIECRRYSSEGTNKQVRDMDETQFRARCGTDVSSLASAQTTQSIASTSTSTSTPNLTDGCVAGMGVKCEKVEPGGDGWFSLWEACGASSTPSAPHTPLPLPLSLQETPHSHPHSYTPLSVKQDSGSPPEAAIEATPENTPIKDTRQRFNFPSTSPAVRALGARLSQPPQPLQHHQLTSSYSQPPSPLKKEPSPFSRISSVEGGIVIDGQEPKKDALYTQHKINRILQDRSQQTSDTSSISSPNKLITASPLKKNLLKDPMSFVGIPSAPNSPVPLGAAAPTSGSTDWPLAKPKPHKDGVPFDIASGRENITNLNILPNVVENMKDDKEIIELSKRGEVMRSTSITRDAHLIFADAEMKLRSGSRLQQEDRDDEVEEHWTDGDAICEGNDKFCNDRKHGLHMPNSSSMLDFARRITKSRSRYYSHCVVESSQTIIRHGNTENDNHHTHSVRRIKSCPDIIQAINEKSKDNTYEKDILQVQSSVIFENGNLAALKKKISYNNMETQTVNIWPGGYDLLLNDYVQKFCEQSKVEDAPTTEDKVYPPVPFSPYSQVDRYIEILSQRSLASVSSGQRSLKEENEFIRQQLQLINLELMYERFRREVHAVRNRRLLGRSRKNRAAEEQNTTLKQQIISLQLEIDELRQQLLRQNKNMQHTEQKHNENKKYWQFQINLRENDVVSERKEKEKLAAQLLELQNVSTETSADVQHLHSALFEASQQLIKANRKSEMCDRLMECIRRMQRELVMLGEKDARYGSYSNIPTKADALIVKITQQYKDQIINSQAMLQAQTSKLEILQARESELEAVVLSKEQVAQDLKKQLRLVKEEYSERLKAVEDKYQAIKRINQRLESYCLELLQKIPQSPQTISRDLTSGFSPQSSPLSASLASSEGHGPLLASRVDEIRNLQVIVNAPETIEESTSSAVNNIFDNENH